MIPGVYSDVTNAEYHGGPGVSKSMLDVLAQSSPMHLHFMRTAANDNDRQPTPAQMLGTAFHALLLEPEEFARTYCLSLRRQDVPEAIEDREVLVQMVQELNAGRLAKLPTSGSKDDLVTRILEAEAGETVGRKTREELDAMKASELKEYLSHLNASRPGLLSTSGNRHELAEILRANGRPVTLWSDVLAQWQENNGHRTVLSSEQWEQLHAMKTAVMAHPAARALLTGKPGKAEQSVYWFDQETGELCRCRPDFWREDDVLVDVKTTEDASLEGFGKSIANWRYDVQDAFYRDGVKAATGRDVRAFVFLAVEKRPPYAVACYALTPEDVELGRLQYRRDLAQYAECQRTGKWPGYGEKIQVAALPAWRASRLAALSGGPQ